MSVSQLFDSNKHTESTEKNWIWVSKREIINENNSKFYVYMSNIIDFPTKRQITSYYRMYECFIY